MKIESTFDINSSRVEITFDMESQNLLLAASRAIAAHFDAKTFTAFCRDLEHRDREYDLDKGSRLFLDLIRSKTRIVETDSDQMQGALTFLCICTGHMLKAGRQQARWSRSSRCWRIFRLFQCLHFLFLLSAKFWIFTKRRRRHGKVTRLSNQRRNQKPLIFPWLRGTNLPLSLKKFDGFVLR